MMKRRILSGGEPIHAEISHNQVKVCGDPARGWVVIFGTKAILEFPRGWLLIPVSSKTLLVHFTSFPP
jgi:hypothetical protein